MRPVRIPKPSLQCSARTLTGVPPRRRPRSVGRSAGRPGSRNHSPLRVPLSLRRSRASPPSLSAHHFAPWCPRVFVFAEPCPPPAKEKASRLPRFFPRRPSILSGQSRFVLFSQLKLSGWDQVFRSHVFQMSIRSAERQFRYDDDVLFFSFSFFEWTTLNVNACSSEGLTHSLPSCVRVGRHNDCR